MQQQLQPEFLPESAEQSFYLFFRSSLSLDFVSGFHALRVSPDATLRSPRGQQLYPPAADTVLRQNSTV